MQIIINIIFFIWLADLSWRFEQLDKFAFGLAADIRKLVSMIRKAK